MKILFFCPDYFEIYRVIEDGMHQYMDCEVKSIIFKGYRYKNVFEKIANFFLKTFLNKNLKKKWASKNYISSVSEKDQFDYLFIICPDFLLLEDLLYLKQKSKKAIVFYWDSFDNIPKYKESVDLFDKKYTFEPKDVEKYKLSFLTNFHYSNLKFPTNNIAFDVFFIGSFDERIHVLLPILDALKKMDKKVKVTLKYSNNRAIQNFKRKEITFIKKSIPFQNTQSIISQSSIILDIQKQIQQGLTFRVFEALGYQKKLITTNVDIKNYDFYNENNIFVWENDTTEIPESFFQYPYEPIPNHILEKYSLNNWINTIFS